MERNIDGRQCINILDEPYASCEIVHMMYMSRKIKDLFPGLMIGYLEYMMFYYPEGSFDERLIEISRNWKRNYFKKLSKVISDKDCNEFDNMVQDPQFYSKLRKKWNNESQSDKKKSLLFYDFANAIRVSLILCYYEGKRVAVYGNSSFYLYFACDKTGYEILYPYYDKINSIESMISSCRDTDLFYLPRKQMLSCGCSFLEMRNPSCNQQLSEFELSQIPNDHVELAKCNCSDPNQTFKWWCNCGNKCEFCAVKSIYRRHCILHPKMKIKQAQFFSIIHYLNEKLSNVELRKCKCGNTSPTARILSFLPKHHNCNLCANCVETSKYNCIQCKKSLYGIKF